MAWLSNIREHITAIVWLGLFAIWVYALVGSIYYNYTADIIYGNKQVCTDVTTQFEDGREEVKKHCQVREGVPLNEEAAINSSNGFWMFVCSIFFWIGSIIYVWARGDDW